MANKMIEYYLVFQQKLGKKWIDIKSFKSTSSYMALNKIEFESYLAEMKKSKKTFRYVKRKENNLERTIEQPKSKEKYKGPITLPISGKVKYLLVFQQKKGNIWGDMKYFSCSSRYIPIDFVEYAKYKKAYNKKPNTRWIKRPILNQKEKPLKYAFSYFKVIQEKKGNEWFDLASFKCKNSLYEVIDDDNFQKELTKIQFSNKKFRIIQRPVSNSKVN